MSSNASSSGIESDTDSSPSLNDDKDPSSISEINQSNDDSMETIIDDNDEGFNPRDDLSSLMPDRTESHPSHSNDHQQSINRLEKKPTDYPYCTKNPYDDDRCHQSMVEDWDAECQMIEPYYYPSYIRRAQWPNHWRWTPPLGIRRTCTQQLHRNFGFERSGLYDDDEERYSNFLDIRHLKFDFL